MNTNITIIALILLLSVLCMRSAATCYDPSGYCSETPCTCEDACTRNWECPRGSFCRTDRVGPSWCGCVFYQGKPTWVESADFAGRCEVAGVHPGPWWFTITVLDILEGDVYAAALRINNMRQILGESGDRIFVWDKGVSTEVVGPRVGRRPDMNNDGQIVYTALGEGDERGTFLIDSPGAEAIRIHDNYADSLHINNVGQVLVGEDSHAGHEGALWYKGVAVPFSELAGAPFRGEGLNNLGHLAGFYVYEDGTIPGLLMNETVVELGGKSELRRNITAINDLDQVAYIQGNSPDSSRWGTFLWDNGTLFDIADLIPCHPVIGVLAMNNCGEMLLVVDDARDTPECEGAFPFGGDGYYSPDTGFRALTTVLEGEIGWDDVYLSDINDRGEIVGSAMMIELQSWRGIIASPLPGDLAKNGSIALDDYSLFSNRFGHETTDHSILCNRADFDEDADTDLLDFATFQNLFTGPAD